MNILQGALNNGTSLTANMASVLDDICNDRIPSSWLHMTYVTCSSLKQWMSELPTKMAYINSCLRQAPTVLALPMFLRPDKLFTVVMQTFARNNFQDIVHITLEFQVIFFILLKRSSLVNDFSIHRTDFGLDYLG